MAKKSEKKEIEVVFGATIFSENEVEMDKATSKRKSELTKKELENPDNYHSIDLKGGKEVTKSTGSKAKASTVKSDGTKERATRKQTSAEGKAKTTSVSTRSKKIEKTSSR